MTYYFSYILLIYGGVLNLFHFLEFSEAEYKAANVDPISQFSKPVAVVYFN